MAHFEITARPARAARLGDVLARIAAIFGRAEHLSDPSDAARRDFVLRKLEENADAFRSDADVQCMMAVYPGRF